MLDFVFENHTLDTEWSEDFFKNIFDHALKYLKIIEKKSLPAGRQVELGLQLITPQKSGELNNQYRGNDKPTDVLSFPLADNTLKKYDILPLGDIFICLEVVKQQAEEIKIPLSQELARLAVHGLLHLLGYDHERSPGDEQKMIDLQEKILETLD